MMGRMMEKKRSKGVIVFTILFALYVLFGLIAIFESHESYTSLYYKMSEPYVYFLFWLDKIIPVINLCALIGLFLLKDVFRKLAVGLMFLDLVRMIIELPFVDTSLFFSDAIFTTVTVTYIFFEVAFIFFFTRPKVKEQFLALPVETTPEEWSKRKHKGLAIASIVFLCIDIALMILFIRIVNSFRGILEMIQPAETLLLMTKIALWSPFIFIIVIVILIAKEWSKKKLLTFIINIAVCIILVLGGIPFLVYGLFLPMRPITEILESEGISGIGIMQASIIAEKVCEEEGWKWANIHIEETDTYWEFTTNYSRPGIKALIRINKKTGEVLEKHIIGP